MFINGQGERALKKVLTGILLFFLIAALSFILNFPTESVFRYYLWQLEKSSGVHISYSGGKFGLFSMVLENLDIIKDGKRLFTFDKVNCRFSPGQLNIEALKDEGSLSIRANSNTLRIEPKNLKLVTKGTKFFKKIDIKSGLFTYRIKQKTGTGKIILDMKEPADQLITSDIQAECQMRIEESSINLNFSRIIGNNVSGNGSVEIIQDPSASFDNSKLNGTLRLNAGPAKVTLNISGTVKNPQVTPAMSPGSRGGL